MEDFPLEELSNEPLSSNPLLEESVSFFQKYVTTSQISHIVHLKSQYDHLQVLHQYHLRLLKTTKDQKLFESYRDIANAIWRLLHQYEVLLVKLESK